MFTRVVNMGGQWLQYCRCVFLIDELLKVNGITSDVVYGDDTRCVRCYSLHFKQVIRIDDLCKMKGIASGTVSTLPNIAKHPGSHINSRQEMLFGGDTIDVSVKDPTSDLCLPKRSSEIFFYLPSLERGCLKCVQCNDVLMSCNGMQLSWHCLGQQLARCPKICTDKLRMTLGVVFGGLWCSYSWCPKLFHSLSTSHLDR